MELDTGNTDEWQHFLLSSLRRPALRISPETEPLAYACSGRPVTVEDQPGQRHPGEEGQNEDAGGGATQEPERGSKEEARDHRGAHVPLLPLVCTPAIVVGLAVVGCLQLVWIEEGGNVIEQRLGFDYPQGLLYAMTRASSSVSRWGW